jgi:hypothetical protein
VWPEQAVAALGADDRDELTKDVDGKIQVVPSNLEHDPEKWVPVFGKDHAPPMR